MEPLVTDEALDFVALKVVVEMLWLDGDTVVRFSITPVTLVSVGVVDKDRVVVLIGVVLV